MKNYKKKTKSQRPIPYIEQPLYDIKKHKVGRHEQMQNRKFERVHIKKNMATERHIQ